MDAATVILLHEWERAGESFSPGTVLTLSIVEAANLVAGGVAEYKAERESRVLAAPQVAAISYKPKQVARYRG